MEVYIGLDVSLASAAICVLGDKGEMVTEAQVASAPDALVSFLRELPHGIAAIGLEASPLSYGDIGRMIGAFGTNRPVAVAIPAAGRGWPLASLCRWRSSADFSPGGRGAGGAD